MIRILQDSDPKLRAKCVQVFDFQDARLIAKELRAAAVAPWNPTKCIGLAANQIGYAYRVVIVMQGGQWVTLVNPVIVERVGEQTVRDACMSVDYGRTYRVRTRPAFIRVEYQDEQAVPQRRKAKGINAAAICHEIDHLDGILFTDEEQPCPTAN